MVELNPVNVDLQTISTKNAHFYIVCISALICSYMFLRNHHPRGVYASGVKTYRNKIVLQQLYISNVEDVVTFELHWC
jgi:hypothetical protein